MLRINDKKNEVGHAPVRDRCLARLMHQFTLACAANSFRVPNTKSQRRLGAEIRSRVIPNRDLAAVRCLDRLTTRLTFPGVCLDMRAKLLKAFTFGGEANCWKSFASWADVLRVSAAVSTRELPSACGSTEAMAARLTKPKILRRLHRLEGLRGHFPRNIQEALAIEVAFHNIFRFCFFDTAQRRL